MINPFVVKVPAGATEIDLRPVLAPIIRAVMRNASDKQEHFSDRDVDRFAERLMIETRISALMQTIKWEWISKYMLDHKWRRADCHSHCQYYPPEDKNRIGPSGLCVLIKEEFIPPNHNEVEQAWRAIEQIAKWRGVRTAVFLDDIETQAKLIVAHVDPVTRLGEVAVEGKTGR